MSNDVFANGMELACKAGQGKSICAFPDVCFTPPQTPATPPGVPIPYPNTGMASDTTSGSKTVKISGQEVMLKDKSCFKRSTGDEAGCAPKKGVVTSKNMGKVYFNAWSMDVKFEGENVVRHLDLTTHNHASKPGNSPPWPFVDSMALAPGGACHKEAEAIKEKCSPEKNWRDHCPPPPPDVRKLKDGKLADYIKKAKADDCMKARKCMLVRYGSQNTAKGCCRGQTGHHLVPEESFKGVGNYNPRNAPVVCAEGPGHSVGTHGQLHALQSHSMRKTGGRSLAYMQKLGAKAVNCVYPESQCSVQCTESQLKHYHEKQAQIPPEQQLNPVTPQKPTVHEMRDMFEKLNSALGR